MKDEVAVVQRVQHLSEAVDCVDFDEVVDHVMLVGQSAFQYFENQREAFQAEYQIDWSGADIVAPLTGAQ